MTVQVVAFDTGYKGWRSKARDLLRAHVAPADIIWQESADAQPSLLASPDIGSSSTITIDASTLPPVPRAFLELAESVACHADGDRWHLLYRTLFRLTHGEPSLLEVATDEDVCRLQAMHRAVKREVHKMHAFVRFRAVEDGNGDRVYVAWFEPVHDVVERAVPLFTRRFASMRWSILTPGRCAHWDGASVEFSAGVPRSFAPADDALEDLWRTYYAHIFNPARLSTATMRSEMPMRYWNNLPEAQLISSLARDAAPRVRRMLQQVGKVAEPLPSEFEVCVATPASAPRYELPSSPAREVETSWHPVHDPGIVVARNRAIAAREKESVWQGDRNGLTINSVSLRIGTASWTDPTLLQRGAFYPDNVASAESRLRFYASRFNMVEVDSTFYVPPTRSMAAAWALRTPDHFVFHVKAFALMTGHAAETKRMPDWLRRLLPRSMSGQPRVRAADLSHSIQDEIWAQFLAPLEPLRGANKLGSILLQFPRWFAPTRESAQVLRIARERLGDHAAAVEFRNPAWVTGRLAPRTVRLLEDLQFTNVVVDAPPGTSSSMPAFLAVTTPGFAMVRLHGRRTATWEASNRVVSERYRYLYDSNELSEWAGHIHRLTERIGIDSFPDMAKARQGVHVVFNNCHANYGTTNADEITALLIEFDKERQRM